MAAAAPAQPISVVMATFNGARFVGELLDSLAAQTQLPAELVVGDDGSVDETIEIIERFAERAPFEIRVFRNPQRLGATENFLTTCMRARGPLIALTDWDDVWQRTKLERVAPWFGDPAVGLVIHRADVVDEALRPLGRRFPDIRRTRVLSARRLDPWFSGSGLVVFRRRLLDVVAPYATDRPREANGHPMDHDDWLYLLSSSLATTVLLAEDLVLYRQHGGSYMGAPTGSQREQVDRALVLDAASFRRQAAMFRSRRELWRAVAGAAAVDASERREAGLSAAWNDRLASLSDARAGVRDDTIGRLLRIARLGRLAVTGGYRPRTMTGLGLRALAADAISLLRPGRAAPADTAFDELARRVAADRAAGRTPEAVMTALNAEGVPPLYGRRWTTQMIRDLVFHARRLNEAEAIRAATSTEAGPKPTS